MIQTPLSSVPPTSVIHADDGILVIPGVHVERLSELLLIVQAVGDDRLHLGFRQGGENHCRQDRYDGYDDEELDEREGAREVAS